MDDSTISRLLANREASLPGAVALAATEGVPLTYRRLAQHVEAAVQRLNALGIGRGDPVALVLPNGPEMAAAFLAIASAATCAPLNPAYRPSEFDFYLSDLEAKALVVQAGEDSPAVGVARSLDIPVIELVPAVDGPVGIFSLNGHPGPPAPSPEPAQPGDVALVLHTSGTTSRPKIVPLTHSNLLESARSIRDSLQLVGDDRCLNVMPLFHIHGLVASLLASLSAGASVLCAPGFYAPQFFSWLEASRPSWYTAVPTMHQAILARACANQHVIDGASLRFIRSCSAALPPKVMAELEATFHVPVLEAYGMTEAAHQMACSPLPPGVRKPGSVGVATGPEVAIMAEDGGRLLPQGETGEIVIRGPSVMGGYLRNPEANTSAFTGGWFRTGDQGFLDADRYLHITGRIKEIINRGGEKISPREIDEILLDHPAVDQAVAFPLPDAELGEDVAAAVVLAAGGATESELRRFVSLRLAPFKVPRRILIVDEIPKGPTGKMQRIGLADRLGLTAPESRGGQDEVAFVSPRNELETLVAEMWCEVLGLTELSVRRRFLDAGGDSILATRLVARLGRTFGIQLTLLDFFEAPTVAEQALVIEGLVLDQIESMTEEQVARLLEGERGKGGA